MHAAWSGIEKTNISRDSSTQKGDSNIFSLIKLVKGCRQRAGSTLVRNIGEAIASGSFQSTSPGRLAPTLSSILIAMI
jgi:hypothetical protein